MIHLRGGKELVVKPAGARQGTDIKVTDLFFNTPARLKYLKKWAKSSDMNLNSNTS